MKKFIPIILCMVIILSACGSQSKSDNYASNSDYDDYTTENEYCDSAPQSAQTSNNSKVSETNKKIIKNAKVDMTAVDVKSCYSKILSYASEKGGYEFNMDMSTSSDYICINAEIKVTPDNLDDILNYIGECGTVINSNITSDDITTQYIDTKIRLENKKKNLDKYYEYYDKAQTMEEALMLQDKIDQLTAEIESYEGQLKYWNTLTSESTISLYIQQQDDPTMIKKDVEWNALSFSDMGKLIYNGFATVINGLVSVVQWIIIIIVTISPLLIIAGIIIFIVLFRKKKKNIKKADISQNDLTENKDDKK